MEGEEKTIGGDGDWERGNIYCQFTEAEGRSTVNCFRKLKPRLRYFPHARKSGSRSFLGASYI